MVVAAGAQTSVTLNGTSYNLVAPPNTLFDGPSGTITTSIKDPDGAGPLTAPKAIMANPAWAAMISKANYWNTSYPYTNRNYIDYYRTGDIAAQFAMIWYSDNSQTTYRAAALDMLNHLEDYYQLFCDETKGDCLTSGGLGYYVGSYGVIYWNHQWIMAYELLRGEMTPTERTAFVSKFVNDLSTFGGISGSPGTSCTNPSANAPGTVSISGTTITATNAIFGGGNQIQVGYWVAGNSINDPIPASLGKIVSITDATHATVSSTSGFGGFNGVLGYRRNTWVDGDCGAMWVGKHGRFAPRAVTYVTSTAYYPPTGGLEEDYYSNNTFAMFGQMMAVYMAMANDDPNATRSKANLTLLYDSWYTHLYSTYLTHGYTGFHYTGSAYGLTRPFDMVQIVAMLGWTINGTPPAVDGIWARNMLYHYFLNYVPSCPSGEPMYGQDFGLLDGFGSPNSMYHVMIPYAYYHATTEGKRFNWAMRNRFSTCDTYGNPTVAGLWFNTTHLSGGSTLAYDQWAYAYTDPSWEQDDLSVAGPTAVALNTVDASTATYPQSALMSRTGYSSTTDTLVNFYAFFEKYADHSYPSSGFYPGAYKIIKGNYLLAGDGDQYTNANYALSSVYVGHHDGGNHSNIVEIGSASNLKTSVTECGATMPRTATDGSSNRYAYAMADSTACYGAGAAATRVHRHLIDFKGGSQQFIVVYDDVATSAGKSKKAYLHYANNLGQTGITDVTRGATSLSANTITSSTPGTGHSDAAQLLTAVYAPGANQVALFTDNPDGSYTGGFGKTYRATACASADGTTCDATNTLGEIFTVHEPILGTSASLPAIAVLSTINANWRGIQIGGGAPKVAVFARTGSTYATATFTTSHTGTAQYVVAGLTPGVYTVSRNGSVVATGVPVSGADNTLYMDAGSAGAWTITNVPPVGLFPQPGGFRR